MYFKEKQASFQVNLGSKRRIQVILLDFFHGTHPLYFSAVGIQDYHPKDLTGKWKVTLIHGVDFYYKPKHQKAKNSAVTYRFHTHRNDRYNMIMNVNDTTNNARSVKTMKMNENLEDIGVAVRTYGNWKVLYLGVGWDRSDTRWLRSDNSPVSDYLVMLRYKVGLWDERESF